MNAYLKTLRGVLSLGGERENEAKEDMHGLPKRESLPTLIKCIAH